MTDSTQPWPTPTAPPPTTPDGQSPGASDRAPDPTVEPVAVTTDAEPAAAATDALVRNADGHAPQEAVPSDMAPPSDMSRALTDAVAALREELAASRAAQEHQRVLLDKLHDERQLLRDAERDRMRDPVLRDLVQLADTCTRNGRRWRARTDVAPETAEAVGSVLGDVADDIGLVLERQGVDAFAPEVGEPFDRTTARAVTTRPTADPLRDGTVAEVRRPGYRVHQRVFRYCDVVVWRFEKPSES